MVPFLAFINHCALQWKVSMQNECVWVCVCVGGGGGGGVFVFVCDTADFS